MTFISIHISYGQSMSTSKNFEQLKDSAFAVLFNSLWAELEITTETKDTNIVLTAQDKEFHYSYDTISDASLSEIMVVPESKYAQLAARYFELKTSIKRPYAHNYFPTPYLTYKLIKKWEKWYGRNKNKIDYASFIEDINKLKSD